jgi:hypothetical protein
MSLIELDSPVLDFDALVLFHPTRLIYRSKTTLLRFVVSFMLTMLSKAL